MFFDIEYNIENADSFHKCIKNLRPDYNRSSYTFGVKAGIIITTLMELDEHEELILRLSVPVKMKKLDYIKRL